MDPRRSMHKTKWSVGSSNTEVVKEKDLISKIDESSNQHPKASEVDCTLKLGMPSYESQLPSSTIRVGPPQETINVSNNIGTLPAQATYNYGMMNGYYVPPIGRINYNNTTSGSYMTYAGPSLPTPPVICNNYGNLYYMNPQNNVALSNNFQPRVTEPSKKCIVCETSTTPLWRKGPDGEKSLCNACGIRYRKFEMKKMEQDIKDN